MKKIGLLLFNLTLFVGIFSFLKIDACLGAEDLMEKAFTPAREYDTIIDMGNTKNAVGNEILREGVGITEGLGQGCFVNNQKVEGQELKKMICEIKYKGTWDSKIFGKDCKLPNGKGISVLDKEKSSFCSSIGGDRDIPATYIRVPLIVSITKFFLRLTIVLAITMVIYSGISYILQSTSGGDTKGATKNLALIAGGIIVALLSLAVIQIINSFAVNSLNIESFTPSTSEAQNNTGSNSQNNTGNNNPSSSSNDNGVDDEFGTKGSGKFKPNTALPSLE